jgi:hypothetical protein
MVKKRTFVISAIALIKRLTSGIRTIAPIKIQGRLKWSMNRLSFLNSAICTFVVYSVCQSFAYGYPIVSTECKANPIQCAKDGKLTAVEIYGVIGYEDQSFFDDIDAAIPADKPFPKVFVDSQGGSGAVGEAIGRILRRRHATVEGGSPYIPETIVECTSACVYVAAGATTRWLNHVGIHQGHYTRYTGPKYWYNEPVEAERTGI